ncbi:MAG: GntR family transcriptional regulator [Lentisphaerae bacterium]|nr:GntR family transcriptional regulator [Lentisphaerota bacterium]
MDREFSKSFRLQTTLMTQILLGEYRCGDHLPSAAELMREFNTSAATVKRVLDELAASKLIRRRRGSSPVVLPLGERSGGGRGLKVVVVRDVVKQGLYFNYRYAPWTWTLQEITYNRLMREHIPVITIGKSDLENMSSLLHSASGVIYISPQVDPAAVDYLEKNQLPYVIITGFTAEKFDNMVCYNYQTATERMAVYLLSCGVKKVNIIANPAVDGRLDGMINLLKKHGFDSDKISHTIVPDVLECAELESFYRPLPEDCRPLGVVCYNDYHAYTVEKQFIASGYRSKKDYVILTLGELLEPRESGYCTLEIEQLVEQGVEMLYRRMKKLQREPVCQVEPVFVLDRKKYKGKML